MPYATALKQVVLFAAAAPVGAFVTYCVLYLADSSYSASMLALAMLFSGGTFLCVTPARTRATTCAHRGSIDPLASSVHPLAHDV